jgi:hypothetical protein
VHNRGLAVLEHENWIAYLTGVVACSRQASVTRAGGAVATLTNLPFDWFNQILIERAGDARWSPPWRGEGAQARRPVRRSPPRRHRRPIRRDLVGAGLMAMEQDPATPGMAAFPIDRDVISVHAPSELQIRRVADSAGIDAHRLVATAGFGTRPESRGGRHAWIFSINPGA